MADEPEKISMTNTKKEMLEAYNALLKEVNAKRLEEPKEEQKRLQEKKALATTEALSSEGVEGFAQQVTTRLTAALADVQRQLREGLEKVQSLNDTIRIKEEWIEDLYAIESNADSLATLILAQKNLKATSQEELAEMKAALEREIEETREAWKKEQTLHKATLKEEDDARALKLKREEEEYTYTTGQRRRAEEDDFRERLQAEEKELEERKRDFEVEYTSRMKALTDSEEELERLRTLAEGLDAQIQKATARATKETEERLEREHRFQFDLAQKETEGQLLLKDQQIELLQAKIKEMETQLKEAGVKVSNSENTVRDIAFRAIDSSASTSRAFALEQTKLATRDKGPEA